MIHAHPLRLLELAPSAGDAAPRHVSAASGMVRVGHRLFVVADDELCLSAFDLSTNEVGKAVRLFDGHLPAGQAARKAVNPDLEALD